MSQNLKSSLSNSTLYDKLTKNKFQNHILTKSSEGKITLSNSFKN